MYRNMKPQLGRLIAALTIVATLGVVTSTSHAQFFRQGAVGGVKIDAEGVLSNPEIGDMKELQAAWQQGLEPVPADLTKWTDLRFVSMRALESQIAEANKAGKPVPDAERFERVWSRVKAYDGAYEMRP